jgi:hypothetical protein
MILFLLWMFLEGVLTASDVCATSQQEYQRLGLWTKTVQRRNRFGRSPLTTRALADVCRNGFAGNPAGSKREIRQNHGGFGRQRVNNLTLR